MYRKHRRAPRKRTEILVNVTSRRCRNSNRASFFPCSSASIFASSATHSPYRFAWHRRAPRLRGQPTDNESAANRTKHSTPFTYPFYATCIFQLSYYTRLATYQHCSPLVNRFYLRRANRGAPQQFAPNNRSTPFLRIRLLRIFLRSNLISFPLPALIYFHQPACVRISRSNREFYLSERLFAILSRANRTMRILFPRSPRVRGINVPNEY